MMKKMILMALCLTIVQTLVVPKSTHARDIYPFSASENEFIKFVERSDGLIDLKLCRIDATEICKEIYMLTGLTHSEVDAMKKELSTPLPNTLKARLNYALNEGALPSGALVGTGCVILAMFGTYGTPAFSDLKVCALAGIAFGILGGSFIALAPGTYASHVSGELKLNKRFLQGLSPSSKVFGLDRTVENISHLQEVKQKIYKTKASVAK